MQEREKSKAAIERERDMERLAKAEAERAREADKLAVRQAQDLAVQEAYKVLPCSRHCPCCCCCCLSGWRVGSRRGCLLLAPVARGGSCRGAWFVSSRARIQAWLQRNTDA